MNKFKQFKKLINSNQTEFICEAHNGISAKVVEEAGFKGIWGSGLTISAQHGVRDNNELSWTQILDNLEFMSDSTDIPILLDGDTGYGNFNNFQRLIKKLEQRNIAAVCIEDKLFPKTNSFISGEKQELAEIKEFSGKISAGKDAQINDDFSIIARVEAFIAGWGLDEALKRADAYHKAGADGILIHSALNNPSEILSFKKEWGDRCPVLIVPTKYYSTPTLRFKETNISVVIWANHLLRSSILSMQNTAKKIFKEQNLFEVEDNIASVPEIFRLQGAKELELSEDKYLPESFDKTSAVILAASRGEELGDLTLKKPKAMLDVGGKSVLTRIVDSYNSAGIKKICIVTGYKPESFDLPNLNYVRNSKFNETGEVFSLSQALGNLKKIDDLIVSYGDVIFKKFIPLMLMDSNAGFSIVADSNWQKNFNNQREADFISCNYGPGREFTGKNIFLSNIKSDMKKKNIDAEWMGLIKISKNKIKAFSSAVDSVLSKNVNAQIPDLLNYLVKQNHKIEVIYTSGHWIDIDSLDDLIKASHF